jgi:RNA polymerase sigma-70 factor (ECF subfamily)
MRLVSVAVSAVQPDFEELRRDILRAVRTVCPGWLAGEAEDLAQIGIARLFDRVQATGGAVEFSRSYLYRIAYTTVIDEIRRRKRLQEVSIDTGPPPESGQAGPDRHVGSKEAREAIRRCFAKLAASRRRAVRLSLAGDTVAEIAAQLECAPKQAENLVSRGRSDLRACLEAQGVTP